MTNELQQLRLARHPSASDIISKTFEPSSSGKRAIANGLGHHQHDGRTAAAQASASFPSASDVISTTDEPQQLSQARHRQRHPAGFS
jgi:hypothetical protein